MDNRTARAVVVGSVVLAALGLLLAACIGQTPTAPTRAETPAAPATAAASPVPPTPTAPTVIRIGALFDLSGPTSQVGAPYADGIRGYIQTVNDQGGVNGRKIALVEADFGYQVPRAVDAYKKLVMQEKVVAILGWDTTDTEALSPLLRQDALPYMSASYAETLVDNPSEHPYNFLLTATYSDQMRALLKYAKDTWKEQARPPAAAFMFPDNSFGRSPMPAARAAAGRLGIKVADEQILPYNALDASSQLFSNQAKGADFIVVDNLLPASTVAVKDAAKLGIKAQMLTLNGGTDEELARSAGPAADMLVGVTPFTLQSEDKPGFGEIKAAYSARGADASKLNVRYVQGWLTAKLMLEGIKRAGDKVTGETIKAGLETIGEYDTGGITAPITWTKDNHAGNTHVKLYQVRNGAWTPLSDFVKVER